MICSKKPSCFAHLHIMKTPPWTTTTRILTMWRPRLQECPRASPRCGAHAFKNAHAQPQVEVPTPSRMPTRSPKLKRPRTQECPRAAPSWSAHALNNARAHPHVVAPTHSRMPENGPLLNKGLFHKTNRRKDRSDVNHFFVLLQHTLSFKQIEHPERVFHSLLARKKLMKRRKRRQSTNA